MNWFKRFFSKKVKSEKRTPTYSNGYSGSNSSTDNDLLSPVNPISPFYIWGNTDNLNNHSNPNYPPAETNDWSNHSHYDNTSNDSSSYDSGSSWSSSSDSSSYDSGSFDSGGGSSD